MIDPDEKARLTRIAQCIDAANAVAMISEGHCPVCTGRLDPNALKQHLRGATTRADAFGYCSDCDATAYTVINRAGKRRVMITFKIMQLERGPRPTIMKEVT